MYIFLRAAVGFHMYFSAFLLDARTMFLDVVWCCYMVFLAFLLNARTMLMDVVSGSLSFSSSTQSGHVHASLLFVSRVILVFY